MKKATYSEEQSRPGKANSTTVPLTKNARVLQVFLGGGSLNRFEAERIGDHCLNTTISTLSNGYGLAFVRVWERVPTRWGAFTSVVRYSLPVSEHEKAWILMRLLTRGHTDSRGGKGDE